MQQRPGFDSHNNFFRRRIRPHRGFAAPFFTPRFCCAVPPPPHQPLPRRWRVGVSRHFSLQNKLDYGAYFTKPFFTYLLATKKNHLPGNWNKKNPVSSPARSPPFISRCTPKKANTGTCIVALSEKQSQQPKPASSSSSCSSSSPHDGSESPSSFSYASSISASSSSSSSSAAP